MKKNIFLKKGENGIIELKDGISLSNQAHAFLFEIEGNRVFTIVSNNGIQSIQLQDKKFEKILSESLSNIDNIEDGNRDDEIHDEEI